LANVTVSAANAAVERIRHATAATIVRRNMEFIILAPLRPIEIDCKDPVIQGFYPHGCRPQRKTSGGKLHCIEVLRQVRRRLR
jgi:hypothetical protein